MHEQPSSAKSNSSDSKTESLQQQSPTSESSSQSTSPNNEQQAPSSDKRRGLVGKGDFNEQIILVGRRGSGKSARGIDLCLDYARIPCYIVAHDLGHKIPDRTHRGQPTYVRKFDSVAEARPEFAKDPRGIWSIGSPSADEVMAWANEIAEGSLDKHGGHEGHPCIFYIDEVVSAEICDPNYIDPTFKQFIMESRHRNVGIIVGTQSARILHNLLFTQATRVEMFSITDQRDHKRLIECGVDAEAVKRTRALPQYKSIVVGLGFPSQ